MESSSRSTDTARRSFRKRRISVTEPLFRERPSGCPRYAEFDADGGCPCFVAINALADMLASSRQGEPDEVIGRLGGRVCQDGAGDYILIEEAVLNGAAQASPGHVVATTDSQWETQKEFERVCRPLDVVGWWHSHPGDRAPRYSVTDRDNQQYWTERHSIGIVVSSVLRGEVVSVYQGPESRRLELLAPSSLDELKRSLRARLAEESSAIAERDRATRRLPMAHGYVPCDTSSDVSTLAEAKQVLREILAVSMATTALILSAICLAIQLIR
jgi:proteasome lid subunit RPN8/RPN11